MPPGRQATQRPSLSPQSEPKHHALTKATAYIVPHPTDDTVPMRPAANLTTEIEPAVRAQAAAEAQRETQLSNRGVLHDVNRDATHGGHGRHESESNLPG